MNTTVGLASALFFLSSAAIAQPVPANETDDYADDLAGYEEATGGELAADPLEPMNRVIHDFNYGVDYILIRPITKGYEFIVPEPGRKAVGRVVDNWEAPVVLANSLLQLDAENSFVTFWRFMFNTTLGVGGLFDIASEMGVPPRRDEDFGQTLGYWGVGHGAYLVLPIMGPSSLRDTPGKVVDWFLQPLNWGTKNWERFGMAATRGINYRSRYGNFIDDTYDNSLDPYATFRSLYLQRRDADVRNLRSDASPSE